MKALDSKIAASSNAVQATQFLLHQSARTDSILSGHYLSVLFHLERVYTDLGDAAGTSDLRLDIARLITDFSAYAGTTSTIADQASQLLYLEYPRMDLSDSDSTRFGVSLVRFIRQHGTPAEEVAVLEDLRPENNLDELEVKFRLYSALNKSGDYTRVRQLATSDGGHDGSAGATIAIASIYGAIAEAALLEGDTDTGHENLKHQFRTSHSVLHARGMYVAAARLSDSLRRLGDLEGASFWLRVAGHFSWLVQTFPRGKEFDLTFLRSEILVHSGGSLPGTKHDRKMLAEALGR